MKGREQMSSENQIPDLNMPEKYVKIIEGKELNIRLAEEITSRRSLFYSAFQQARDALEMIVNQTRTFYEDGEYKCLVEGYDDDCLSLYNGSIIAFEAQRGYGKTQTMLSFSHWMENLHAPFVRGCRHRGCGEQLPCACDHRKASTCYDADEKDACTNMPLFVVLPMIAPSAFEEKQNLLYVVLSRLYNHAQDLVREKNMSEEKRMELSRILQKCLSGINGFKKLDCQSSYDDFSSLQDVCDGLALRKHFWELLYFLAKEEAGPCDTFFVIQLDDVDSQIKNGYQVLDDIRKYLLIPNLVILMSTDEDLLFRAIQEEHFQQFKALNSIDPSNMPSLVAKISKKYINKLIPPSHMVHLPRLEQYLESAQTRLALYYLKRDVEIERISSNHEDREKIRNALVLPWQDEVQYNAQKTLFMLIFRKTGIAFTDHANYMHNIIPRSLRGLNQLIFFLNKMEDIPQFGEKDFKSEYDYVSAWEKRIKISELNLAYFKNYFLNEWLDAKITHVSTERNDRQFLRDLMNAPKDDRIILAIDYLTRIFPKKHTSQERETYLDDKKFEFEKELRSLAQNDKSNAAEFISLWQTYDNINSELKELSTQKPSTPAYTVLGLNHYMIELSKEHRTNENHLLFFSIHVLLSIASHMMILQEKKCTIASYLSEKKELLKNGFNDLIGFPLSPEYLGMPKTFPTQEKSFIHFDKNGLDFPITAPYPKKGINDLWREWDRLHGSNLPNLNNGRTIFESFLDENQPSKDYILNIMNFPTVLLNLGSTYNAKYMQKLDKAKSERQNRDDTISISITMQKQLYYMQEIAIFILANWDVQEKIYKYLQSFPIIEMQNNNQNFADLLYQYNRYGRIEPHLYSYIFAGVDWILKDEKYFRPHMDYLFQIECFGEDMNGGPNVGLSKAFIECLINDDLLFSGLEFSNFFGYLFKGLSTDGNTSNSDSHNARNTRQTRKDSSGSNPPQQSDTNKES